MDEVDSIPKLGLCHNHSRQADIVFFRITLLEHSAEN